MNRQFWRTRAPAVVKAPPIARDSVVTSEPVAAPVPPEIVAPPPAPIAAATSPEAPANVVPILVMPGDDPEHLARLWHASRRKDGPVAVPRFVTANDPLPTGFDKTEFTIARAGGEVRVTRGACTRCYPIGDVEVIEQQIVADCKRGEFGAPMKQRA